jgi:hypothetical protein
MRLNEYFKTTTKETLFSDFKGEIKAGAWAVIL